MPLNRPAERYLGEFHGLSLPTCPDVAILGGCVHSNPIGMMTDLLYPEFAPYIQRCHPQPLCPIAYGGGICLFAAENGEVVWLDEQFRYFALSPSVEQTVRYVFEARPPDGVGPWMWIPEGEAPHVEYFADRPPQATPPLPLPPLWARPPGHPGRPNG